MGMYTNAILVQIGKRPGIRLPEIADYVGCDVQMVEVSIKDQLASGAVIAEKIEVPSSRPTWAYRLRDAAPAVSPAPLRAVEDEPRAPAPASAVPKPPQRYPSLAAAPKRTKVELAMDFIRSKPTQEATDAELRAVMSLTKDQYPSVFLTTPRGNGEIHKDGAVWKLGPAVRVTEEQRTEIAEILNADFRCAVWSSGELHLARGEQTVMKLSAREVAQLREYLAVDRVAA